MASEFVVVVVVGANHCGHIPDGIYLVIAEGSREVAYVGWLLSVIMQNTWGYWEVFTSIPAILVIRSGSYKKMAEPRDLTLAIHCIWAEEDGRTLCTAKNNFSWTFCLQAIASTIVVMFTQEKLGEQCWYVHIFRK